MSKPIINGIDVSECYFYGDNNCDVGYIADSYPKNCKNNPNCYYKQLKRLQEENEELKEKIESYNCNANCYKYKEVNKYKQALEEIIEMLMCKIYGLNENASQLDYMCYTLDKFEKIRIKILTKINEVLNDRD